MGDSQAALYRWDEIDEDHPIPLLHRKRIFAENLLVARVRLERGCEVARHAHASEQVAVIVSGLVRWSVGEEGSPTSFVRELTGGEVMVVPPNVPHGVEALEDTVILDFLSPPGLMGIDNQDRAH